MSQKRYCRRLNTVQTI